MTEAREHHVQFHKTAQEAIAQKLKDRDGGVPPASARNRARHALILDHFREIADGPNGRAKVFLLPSTSSAAVSKVQDFLQGLKNLRQVGVVPAVEDDVSNARTSPPVFFTFSKAKPSVSHFMYVHPGAGRVLRKDHVAVALHSPVACDGLADPLQFTVTCQSVGDHSNSDNVDLLSTVSSDPAKLEQELQCWQTGRCLQY